MTGPPSIHTKFKIAMKSGRVTIFKTTLAVMDYPEFYRFLYNPDTQSLAIEPCEMDAPGAYALVGVKKEETYDVSSIDFVRMMYRANRWNQEISYRVAGIAYPDLKTAVFALRDALEIPQMQVSQGFAAFHLAMSRIAPRHSQTTHCLIFVHTAQEPTANFCRIDSPNCVACATIRC